MLLWKSVGFQMDLVSDNKLSNFDPISESYRSCLSCLPDPIDSSELDYFFQSEIHVSGIHSSFRGHGNNPILMT